MKPLTVQESTLLVVNSIRLLTVCEMFSRIEVENRYFPQQ